MTETRGQTPPPSTARCFYCGNKIYAHEHRWMTALGERPPAPAALPIECPARLIPGRPGTFERHAPEP
ncbi:hypothetical protein ACFYUV_38005 [Nonomuraea sp. NPDC003560]|uniref:hypothetical protein n=1 Tax=Nonomuraea sp. NPDC003560 TaxID=3364341 RepID=UPI00367896C3